MGILVNYEDGVMDRFRSISYSETGTQTPYVTKDINNPPNNNSTIGLQVNKRIDDTSRIAQMLVDRPGLKHLSNEALLKQSDTINKLQKGDFKKQDILPQIANTAKYVAQVAGSTLAQVPVNGTGTHFLRGFRTDTYLQDNLQASGFAEFFGAGGKEGAPLALRGETIIPDNEGQSEYAPSVESSLELKILGSNTASKFQSNLEALNNTILDPKKISTGKKTTLNENPLFTDTERTTQLIDFRKLKGRGYRSDSYSLNYSKSEVKRETRVGLGNQGDLNANRTSYSIINSGSIDKINYLDVKTVSNGEDGKVPSLVHTQDNESSRDFIKFNFQIITPDDTTYLYFRAFLTQFDDNYQSSWDSTKYLGRAENFYTYQGFERSINIGFNIAAASRAEMKPLYRKMAALASVTAPTYGNDGRFMRGTIAKVTIGDYLYEVPGIIESVNYTWNTNYNWEIAFQNPDSDTDDDVQELPQIMDCSLTFKPIHTFIPQAVGKNRLLPYITNPDPPGTGKAAFISNNEFTLNS